jgi:hypothetical protein
MVRDTIGGLAPESRAFLIEIEATGYLMASCATPACVPFGGTRRARDRPSNPRVPRVRRTWRRAGRAAGAGRASALPPRAEGLSVALLNLRGLRLGQ